MAIAAKIKKIVGTVTSPVVVDVEKGQIRRFAQAIGETNEIHFDEKAAKSAGFAAIVAPLTFPASLLDFENAFPELELNLNRTMHRQEEYDFTRPLLAGEQFKITYTLTDAYDQTSPNGKLLFLHYEAKATDLKRAHVFTARRILVEFKK